MPKIEFEVDELDREWILRAIAAAQRYYRLEGEICIAGGEGDLGGRILGEICRAWIDDYGPGCDSYVTEAED